AEKDRDRIHHRQQTPGIYIAGFGGHHPITQQQAECRKSNHLHNTDNPPDDSRWKRRLGLERDLRGPRHSVLGAVSDRDMLPYWSAKGFSQLALHAGEGLPADRENDVSRLDACFAGLRHGPDAVLDL